MTSLCGESIEEQREDVSYVFKYVNTLKRRKYNYKLQKGRVRLDIANEI